MKRDLKVVGMSVCNWYSEAQDRGKWSAAWNQRLIENQQVNETRPGAEKNGVCVESGRCFRRESDKACHKCVDERKKPVKEQVGAVQCDNCGIWFKSTGGLKVHSCRRQEEAEYVLERSRGTTTTSQEQVVCRECWKIFRREGDLKRHKCLQERSKPVEQQSSSVQYARDGLGVLVAPVCTENAFMKQKAGTCSFNRRTRDLNG